ncbi:MlaD family protein [Amycolatopsis sp.]|uniref:MlaD family protein n=1 Tax=Amycolatopsis sp. TaxID=37632 RepID=UPI002DFE796C|nr:MlaD family protein [Amycolatopsis sp.]
MGRKRILIAGAIAVVAVAAALYVFVPSGGTGYRLKLVMPEAAGIVEGLPVRINNVGVGEVTGLTTQDGKAVVDVRIDDGTAPLHTGTKPVITYRALVGESYLQLAPGPKTNPALPSGSVVATDWSQVQVEDVLEALDPPTRDRLKSLLAQTSSTLSGREQDLQSTLNTAGPTVQALGQVLAAVGQDGPSIRELVTKLSQMTSAVAARRTDLSSAVSELSGITQDVAAQQKKLTEALGELPSTLQAAHSNLDKVGGAVDAAGPLLKDLKPVSEKLPSVAGNLSPLLADLRPAVAELVPTLKSADTLLHQTPGLLDSAHAVLPGTTQALNGLAPALDFLRPYTPDLVGWLSNWAGVFGGFNSQGHYGHLLLTVSATGFHNNPGVKPPFLNFDPNTAPGSAAGQPWTDANREPIR